MTIPQYDLATRRRLPPAFPPVVAAELVPARFDKSYVGTKTLRRTIRGAMISYAAAQLSFWQFSIVIAALGLLAIPISSRGMPGWGIAVLVLIFAVGVLVMPVRQAVGVRRAADSYAVEGERYSSKFDESTIFWQTPTDTYAVPWVSIDKAVFKRELTILTVKSSRAICVLPNELLTPDARSRLSDLDQHRHEMS